MIDTETAKNHEHSQGVIDINPSPEDMDILSPLLRIKTSTRSGPEYSELISYGDVLVIRNNNSAISMQIADYFQAERNVPDLNICNISTSTSETISRTTFENEIRTPIEDYITSNGLEDTINFIVTTKGVPLRISEENLGDDNINDPSSYDRASVDSELTIILGSYSVFIGGGGFMMPTPITYIQNPYYNSFQEFSHSDYDIFLVTRLTGYNFAQIKSYIDKVPEAVGRKGTFVFDESPGSYPEGNQWLEDANATLTAKGFHVIHNQTNAFLTDIENVSGYTSWGSNEGSWYNGANSNFGFETDSNSDKIPDNWFVENDTGNDQIDRNDTDKRYGSWSVRINRSVSNSNYSAISQNVSIKPGTRYFLRGQVNVTAVLGGKGAHIRIRAYNDTNQLVWEKNGSARTGTTTNWVSLNQIIHEPIDNVTKIMVSAVLSESSGEAYFDDIRLIEIKPHNSWLPGALVETYVSTSGRTFNYPASYGQSLAADLILDGVSGTKAYVYEPYLDACAHPDILFDAYTDGFYSAESYYMASEYLSWMDVVVCDPKLAVYKQSIIQDLAVTPNDISFSDNQPKTGSIIDIYINVHNLGNYSANGVVVHFFEGDPQSGGTYLGESLLDVSPQSQNQTSLSWNTSGYIGDYNITVVVDASDKFFEIDESNNQANTTITVNTGYPFADAGPDAPVNEDSPHIFDGSGSFDNTSIANYTWDFGDGEIGYEVNPSHTYTSQGIYVVVLNVTNVYGLWDLDTVDITVNNVKPTANAGEDKSGDEGIEIQFNGSDSTDTPSDVDSLTYTWYFGDGNIENGKVVSHTYDDNGSYVVTLEVTDDDSAVSMDIANVTVNNLPPTIIPVPPQLTFEDELFTLGISATDVTGDTLYFFDNSSMFNIDPATGIINFTPKNEDVGWHLINIWVTDEDGGINSIEIEITVENTNDPPYIVSIPITEAVEETLYEYQIVVEDDDTLVTSDEVFYYSLDLAPSGMEINSSGVITWVPNDFQASQMFTVILNVTDGEEFDVQIFNVNVTNTNDGPTITSIPITSVNEDSLYQYNVSASDLDIGDILNFALDLAPDGMSIDSQTGLISWLPTNEYVGGNEVVVNVTDIAGAFDTQEFTVLVKNTNDAPVLETIDELIATEDEQFYYQIEVTDVDEGDILSFYDNTPLFEINKDNGLISFTPLNHDVGTYIITITVSDSEGEDDTETFTLTVLNTNDPPALDYLGGWVLTEDTPFYINITAYDMDIGDSLTYFDNTSLFDIDPQTGEISFTPTNENVGVHVINISVMDESGDEAWQEVWLTVENVNDPPSIVAVENATLSVGEYYSFIVEADDIDPDDTLEFSDNTDLFDIDPNTGEISFTPGNKDVGVHNIEISVRDSEGESASVMISIEIVGGDKKEDLHFIWLILVLILAIIVFIAGFLIRRRAKASEKEILAEQEVQSSEITKEAMEFEIFEEEGETKKLE